MEDFILKRLSEAAGQPVTAEMAISDTGVDSLDLVELVMDVEQEFDTDISDDAIDAATVAGFIAACQGGGKQGVGGGL